MISIHTSVWIAWNLSESWFEFVPFLQPVTIVSMVERIFSNLRMTMGDSPGLWLNAEEVPMLQPEHQNEASLRSHLRACKNRGDLLEEMFDGDISTGDDGESSE